LREEHFPTAIRSATASNENTFNFRASCQVHICQNGDLLNKPQIQLFEPCEPTTKFGSITKIDSLLQEERCDLTQRFCRFNTIGKSTEFRSVHWSNARGCSGTSMISLMLRCGVVGWNISNGVADLCSCFVPDPKVWSQSRCSFMPQLAIAREPTLHVV
jgi:hypothetical protein